MKRILFLGIALAAAIPLSAATTSWDFTTLGQSLNNGNGYSLGEVFTVTSTFTLDYLGYHGTVGNFLESHPVAIYDAFGNLLDSTTIDNSSGIFDGSYLNFVYNFVTPITMFAGQTYVIDGASGLQDPYAFNDTGFTVFAPINVLGDNWGFSGDSFTGTTVIGDVSDGYWGPVFGWDPQFTPEPGTLLLAGTALLGAGLLRHRKQA